MNLSISHSFTYSLTHSLAFFVCLISTYVWCVFNSSLLIQTVSGVTLCPFWIITQAFYRKLYKIQNICLTVRRLYALLFLLFQNKFWLFICLFCVSLSLCVNYLSVSLFLVSSRLPGAYRGAEGKLLSFKILFSLPESSFPRPNSWQEYPLKSNCPPPPPPLCATCFFITSAVINVMLSSNTISNKPIIEWI